MHAVADQVQSVLWHEVAVCRWLPVVVMVGGEWRQSGRQRAKDKVICLYCSKTMKTETLFYFTLKSVKTIRGLLYFWMENVQSKSTCHLLVLLELLLLLFGPLFWLDTSVDVDGRINSISHEHILERVDQRHALSFPSPLFTLTFVFTTSPIYRRLKSSKRMRWRRRPQ